jgi:hypothetical protein
MPDAGVLEAVARRLLMFGVAAAISHAAYFFHLGNRTRMMRRGAARALPQQLAETMNGG